METEQMPQLHWGAGDESRNVESWSEILIEEDRGEYVEAFTYEDGDRSVELIARNGSTVAVIVGGSPVELYDVDEDTEGVTVEDAQRWQEVEPYQWGSEGPMMNYWYPASLDDDHLTAAAKIADLPLCVVTVDDEDGLALTGGGMDLSWDIATAFVRLGMYPPAFVRSLPDYAGMTATPEHRRVLGALIERNERNAAILAREAERFREQLDRMPTT